VDGSEQARRSRAPATDGATAERVHQAAQLFANLTQPGQPQRNGARPQPAADPEGSERLPETKELLELLHATVAANDLLAKQVAALRADLDVTIGNVKLLHRAVKKALRTTNARVAALEEAQPPEGSDPG